MALSIPRYLPRNTNQQNKSTQILSKIGEISISEFTASLTTSWIDELNEAIRETKDQIKIRILSDLPAFEKQLDSSKSVQTRLQDLANNVDRLYDSVSNPETGLRQSLFKQLEEHSLLAQNTLDARVKHQSLSYLMNCMASFESLSDASDQGDLATAVKLDQDLQILMDNSPEPLPEASIFLDLKQQVRVVRSSVDERLDDAYRRSIRISPLSLIVCPAVQVRQSQTIIKLQDILTSLSSSALTEHLSIIRRDLVHYFFEESLKTPHSVDILSATDETGTSTFTYSLFPSSPENTSYIPPFEYLSFLLNFLSKHLFSALPVSERVSFPQSLSSPLTKAILQNFLLPSIPSSIEALHIYLTLLSEAVKFEQNGITAVLDGSHEPEISTWAQNINMHYSRRRRTELRELARAIILNSAGVAEDRFTYVEVVDGDQAVPEDSTKISGENYDAAWDLDKDVTVEDSMAEPTSSITVAKSEAAETRQDEVNDPSDAWGWDDDEQMLEEDPSIVPHVEKQNNGTNTIDESDQPVWDAWDELEAEPLAPPPVTQPKQAKRLEKFNMKHKGGKTPNADPNSSTSFFRNDVESTLASPILPATASMYPNNSSPPTQPSSSAAPENPPQPIIKHEKEIYQITGCARDILGLVDNVLNEGEELIHSTIFDDFFVGFASLPSTSNTAMSSGAIIKSTAVSILDLYRALYPIFYSGQLDESLAKSIRFSNDCEFLHQEVMKRVASGELEVELKQSMREAAEEFLYLAEEWTQATVLRAQERFKATLSRANGFVDTANQSNFDEYEAIVIEVLQGIIALGCDWKKILPTSKYHWAIGMVVEASLTSLIEVILAFHDITEVESHRLSELCKMLHALEKLFVDSVDSPSVTVAYVPSWLKFSYLSELLEASMADISYLFDEGALVDFEIKELVGLVRALFADTPIRANAIARLSNGHPNSR